MAERLEYNESRGSLEAHEAVMKNRVDNAETAHKWALEKGFPLQIKETKQRLDLARAAYEEFLAGFTNEAQPQEKEETIQ